MEIYLPTQFYEDTMYDFINNIFEDYDTKLQEPINLHFEHLRFIKPSGFTILHNIIQWLHKKGRVVNLITPNTLIPNKVIEYLDDSGFFKHYLGKTLFSYSKLRSSTIALKNVVYEEYNDWLENTLIAWLKSQLKVGNTYSFAGFKNCIGEIFNNINDHSGEKNRLCFCSIFSET